MLTQAYLKTRLRYEPETGLFFWIGAYGPGRKATGRICAGSLREDGYIEIRIDSKPYRANQLAWLYMNGEPTPLVEHKNRCRSDNRWINLRQATSSQNACNRRKQSNNRSGFKGVFWNTQAKKWHAKINIGKRQFHLGYFDRVEDAAAAYRLAALQLHGEFACS